MEAFFENVGMLLALKFDILAGLATRIKNWMTLDVAEWPATHSSWQENWHIFLNLDTFFWNVNLDT
jgi:hypothetical protein